MQRPSNLLQASTSAVPGFGRGLEVWESCRCPRLLCGRLWVRGACRMCTGALGGRTSWLSNPRSACHRPSAGDCCRASHASQCAASVKPFSTRFNLVGTAADACIVADLFTRKSKPTDLLLLRSRHWTPLAFCRCRLLALDCQNQLPCKGKYPCAATFLVGRHILTEGETLRFSEAELQVNDSTLELQLPSPADIPGGDSLTVHIEI